MLVQLRRARIDGVAGTIIGSRWLDKFPVNPVIDESRPSRSASPELPFGISADQVEPPNTLGASSGTLSDVGRKPLLPALSEAPAPCAPARGVPVGILLYLASVGIIAAATVGVFFGIGFFLLAQPTAAMFANEAAAEQGSAVSLRLPQIMVEASPTASNVVSVPIKPEVPRSAATAVLPVVSVAPPIGDVPTSDPKDKPAGTGAPGSEAHEASLDASAPAAPAAEPALGSSATVPTFAETARLSSEQITELLARGDTFLSGGDVASARLFYERAAEAGDRQAAMRVGATFDPAFLGRVGLHARGDPAKALSWYRHALDLGALKTDRQAEALETK
jgi:hypothetical protein